MTAPLDEGGTLERHVRLRRLTLGLALVAFAIAGMRIGAMPPGEGAYGRGDLIVNFVIASLLTLWCVFDADVRGKSLHGVGAMVILLAWPLALPVYFLWSRGAPGLVPFFLHGLAAAGAGTLGYFAGSFLPAA